MTWSCPAVVSAAAAAAPRNHDSAPASAPRALSPIPSLTAARLCDGNLAGTAEDIGVVERAPNSSDEDSDGGDDDDINDDGDDSEGKLPLGAAKVRWAKREDVRTEYTENLTLVDRVFLLGDIVARAADQLGQTGIVVGMRMFCDVPVSYTHLTLPTICSV